MVRLCCLCEVERAVLRRPKTFEQVCRNCFYAAFEREIHETIVGSNMFKPGDRVAVAASGGKDSTVLAHLLTTLNERHGYGLDLFLLSVDEGISGYRDDSLETVKRNEAYYGIPLKVVSYRELYGWTMDEIVAQVGTRNNCTFCGVFRRQALDRGAMLMKADKVATGHNADDLAETVLLNMLRGDVARLGRCTSIITGEDGDLPRVKPFKYAYEKEIVMYAYFKKLDYFSTECVYAPFAARGFARDFIKDLEAARPSAIIDLIRSAEHFRFQRHAEQRLPQPRTCDVCGFISSQPVCKACTLLEGLNRGRPGGGGSRVGDGEVVGYGAHCRQAEGKVEAGASAGGAEEDQGRVSSEATPGAGMRFEAGEGVSGAGEASTAAGRPVALEGGGLTSAVAGTEMGLAGPSLASGGNAGTGSPALAAPLAAGSKRGAVTIEYET